jgi:hypothetical protein
LQVGERAIRLALVGRGAGPNEESKMNAAKVARRFAETFDGCTAAAVQHNGEWYIVTDETGDGCFAYAVDTCADALDAVDDATDAGLAEDVAPYQVFCDHADPEGDEAVAAAVWRAVSKRICHAGSCDPVDIAV